MAWFRGCSYRKRRNLAKVSFRKAFPVYDTSTYQVVSKEITGLSTLFCKFYIKKEKVVIVFYEKENISKEKRVSQTFVIMLTWIGFKAEFLPLVSFTSNPI